MLVLDVLLPVTGTAPGVCRTRQLLDQSSMLAEFLLTERHSTRSLDRLHGSVSPNGRKSWRTSTGTCWVLGLGGLLPLEPLQHRHLLPLQLLVVPSEAGNCLLLPHSSLSGTTTVRLPIACSNTYSRASTSAEPRALLVFSRVPVLLLCKGATSLLLLATGPGRRNELQLEDWIEVFWRG